MATSIPSGVAPLDITLKQGADTTITMTWYQDDGVTPMNLTGYVMNLPVRAFYSSPTILLNLSSQSSSGSYIQLGGTAGTITLIFSHADTLTLVGNGLPVQGTLNNPFPSMQVGVQNLEFIPPGGQIGYLFQGALYIQPNV